MRLAVGEACARAVRRCRLAGSTGPVVLTVRESPEPGAGGFQVEVRDDAGAPATGVPDDDEPPEEPEDPVVLALLRGLADEVEVLDGEPGCHGLVRMTWHPGK